jgi:alpha-L-rhamnosidase
MHGFRSLAFALAALLPAVGRAAGPAVRVTKLRCEMMRDPLGIDAAVPRLSWNLEGEARDIRQLAYEVLVATTPEKLAREEGDLWSSGRVDGRASIGIPYAGRTLHSDDRCYWKVRVWTTKGKTAWSAPATWSMGLLRAGDWTARWIGLDGSFPWDSATAMFSRLSARYFRKTFHTTGAVASATLHISGLGFYRLYINGHRIGDQVLTPVPTDYTRRILYNTYDVTREVSRGENVVGVVLGNGLFFTMRQHYKTYKIKNFGFPKLIAQLDIRYRDGSTLRVVTDSSWKVTADGPIRSDNIYDGEDYDATREMKGWTGTGYPDAAWVGAELVTPPGGVLRAQMQASVRVMDSVVPASVHYLRPGVYILDMGQNMAGWLRMRVEGTRGHQVTLRFAETLQANGEISTANLRDAKATDVYTLKGGGVETWEPSFVYHGFRYVEITGYPGVPTTGDFTGEVVYNGIPATGSFRTSDTVLNQVYHNAVWSIKSNYKGIPVDCPQRNERMPWLGDRDQSAYGESFVMDNENLYAGWLRDISDAQTAEGVIPDVAPAYWHYYSDDITWPATYFTVADMLYRQYGDARPVVSHYASMRRWVAHIRDKYMKDGLVPRDKYGDWCMPPGSLDLIHAITPSRITDGTLIATAYYYHILTLMRCFARLAGKPADTLFYDREADTVRRAFNRKFYNRTRGVYSNGTVTADVLPLYFGMTPPGEARKVFANVTDTIERVYHRHISTGVIGTSWLMRTLTDNGRPDLAYDIATATTYPGWGYMAAQGATTTWELWNGNKANPRMSSRNHVMLLGDLVVWLYEDIAGIKTLQSAPGFSSMIMKPRMTDSLGFVDASYQSVQGLVRSDWTTQGGRFHWDITLPPNTEALVYVPVSPDGKVTEGDLPAARATGVRYRGTAAGWKVYQVGSGHYSFDAGIAVREAHRQQVSRAAIDGKRVAQSVSWQTHNRLIP